MPLDAIMPDSTMRWDGDHTPLMASSGMLVDLCLQQMMR
jgi:hypothetical protein